MQFSGRPPFVLDGTTQIKEDRSLFAAKLLQDILSKGAHLRIATSSRLGLPGIEFQHADSGPKESYDLQVTASGIKIGYTDDAGALYAVETLRQLLPAEIDSPK